MIYLLVPLKENKPQSPVTLEIGEIEGFNFGPSANYAYNIIHTLFACDLIKKMPYHSPVSVESTIQELIKDLDLGDNSLQINQKRCIRVQFEDELLSVEVFIGV